MRPPAVLLALCLAGCGGGSGQPDAQPPAADAAAPDAAAAADAFIPADIAEYLATIPGLSFTEDTSEHPDYRRFLITFDQPLDHGDPDGPGFGQRLVLHHIAAGAPMILYTSGYMLFADDYLSELAVMLDANQVSTEQRFFDQSIPDPVQAADWNQVTIAQAAADHHRLVEALAPYYRAAWINTGHSKGGMTSIYHRRFYPDDVDATVAYVAPISFGAPDPRYLTFFDAVGPAGCQAAVETAQREALERFAAMLDRAQSLAANLGYQYTRWGDQAPALESDIASLHWAFWQYAGGQSCTDVPTASATDDQIFAFISEHGGIGAPDHSLEQLQTYYYQAATQLGFPDIPSDHLTDLLQYQAASVQMPPDGVVSTYDEGVAMQDVANWVQTQGSELMFVYGEWDPWSGGAFDPGGATDTHVFVVPQANHGAMLRDLAGTDRTAALDVIERWTGVQPMTAAAFSVRPPPPALPGNDRLRLRLP